MQIHKTVNHIAQNPNRRASRQPMSGQGIVAPRAATNPSSYPRKRPFLEPVHLITTALLHHNS